MPQPNDLSRSLVALNQDGTLIAIIEMSRSSWLVAGIVPGIARHPLKKLMADQAALLGLLERWRGEATQAGRQITCIAVAFEAGRDGVWLDRWLRARGIEAYVIHPTSVAVSREHRRAKTDRRDTALLKRVFLGWLCGEPDHCTMAAVPTLEEEDARRPNRERESLVGERTRVVNRMKATLARLGIRGFKPTLRDAPERLTALRTPEGAPLPPNTLAELRRDMARLRLVRGQIRGLRGGRLGARGRAPGTAGGGARLAPARDGAPAGPRGRHRRRDGRHAGARGAVARAPGPAGGGALRRADRLAGRERREAAREGARQGGQRAGAAWHDPAGVAVPPLPEGQRAGALVPGADRGRPRRDAQGHDRGPGPEAPARALAAGDHRRDAGRSGLASGRVRTSMPKNGSRACSPSFACE